MSVKYKKNGTFINIPTGGSGSGGSANIWEGTAEELETQQPSIPNESLLLVNNDGMGGVVLDAELSTTSENAIQNKAVATAINSTNSSISELQGSVSTNTSNISSINDTLGTVPILSDTISTTAATPRDADTLSGHAASYFATNDSLNTKFTDLNMGNAIYDTSGFIHIPLNTKGEKYYLTINLSTKNIRLYNKNWTIIWSM